MTARSLDVSRARRSIRRMGTMNAKILAAAGLLAGLLGLSAGYIGAALALTLSSATMLTANVVVLLRKDRQ